MKVASVIVLYHPDNDLLKNLVLELKDLVDFFIVDNSNFHNEVIPKLKNVVPSLNYFHLGANEGLARAQNVAIKKIMDCSFYSHILFFDQDSFLSRQSFQEMILVENKFVAEGIKLGALGPVCFDPNDKIVYPMTRYIGPFIERLYLKEGQVAEVSFLISSGMLVKIDILNKVGLMNEDFFIDYIDIEWSFRAYSYGFKLFGVGSGKMAHLIGDSRFKFLNRTISRHSPLRRYYLLRNFFKVLRIPHIPFAYKIREIFLSLARFFVFLVYSDNRIDFLKYSYQAVRDAFRGNFGKYKGS